MGIEFAAQVAEHAGNLATLMKDPEPGMPAWASMVRDDAQWLSDWWAGKMDGGGPMALPKSDVKYLEIRDSMTMIPALAVKLASNPATRTAGYDPNDVYVQLTHLQTHESSIDPSAWKSMARTMPHAHRHIIEHWESLKNGDVVDVEFILGHSSRPKSPEMSGWK